MARGRVAAHEMLIGTPAIRNLIRENKVAQMYSSLQTGQQYGMQTLDQAWSNSSGAISFRHRSTQQGANKDAFAWRLEPA
jgi:twitching motility protein PilT